SPARVFCGFGVLGDEHINGLFKRQGISILSFRNPCSHEDRSNYVEPRQLTLLNLLFHRISRQGNNSRKSDVRRLTKGHETIGASAMWLLSCGGARSELFS